MKIFLKNNFLARASIYIGIAIAIFFGSLFYRLIENKHTANKINYTPPPGILVIDLNQNGLDLTPTETDTGNVYFDIDNDKFSEQTSWVLPTDGFLAIDINQDGKISSASELFGSINANGFLVLSTIDTDKNGQIDEHDTEWNKLLIWADKKQDGHSQTDEISSLQNYNIRSISLKTSDTGTPEGPINQTSQVQFLNGKKSQIGNVLFKYNQTNSVYVENFKLNVQTLFLPTLRGFGTIPDLHIAMSKNDSLLKSVADLAHKWTFNEFSNGAVLNKKIENILFAWAGSKDVDPHSRGPNIDARKLEFLEKFLGRKFLQQGANPNPLPNAANLLNDSWNNAFLNMKAHILTQVGAQDLFKSVSYNPVKGDIEGNKDLSEKTLHKIALSIKEENANPVTFWLEIANYLKIIKKFENFSESENILMDNVIKETDPNLSWDQIKSKSLME